MDKAQAREMISGLIAEHAPDIVRKVDNDLPRSFLEPAKVLAVDTNPDNQFINVQLQMDSDADGDVVTSGVSLVGPLTVGGRVMVLWDRPHIPYVIGVFDCEPRIELIVFSSANELATGDNSAPARAEADGTILDVWVDLENGANEDSQWVILHATEAIVTVTVPAGTTSFPLYDVNARVRFEDGPLTALCADDGDGGWGKVTITCVFEVSCQNSAVTLDDGGGGPT